jgi:hypothetical protein
VISQHASAVVTAFIARDTFCGDGSSISPLPMAASDGSENVTGRSFIANMSTALRVNPRGLVSGVPPPARGIA